MPAILNNNQTFVSLFFNNINNITESWYLPYG